MALLFGVILLVDFGLEAVVLDRPVLLFGLDAKSWMFIFSNQHNSYSTSLSSIELCCWSFFGSIKVLRKKIIEGPKMGGGSCLLESE